MAGAPWWMGCFLLGSLGHAQLPSVADCVPGWGRGWAYQPGWAYHGPINQGGAGDGPIPCQSINRQQKRWKVDI